ncbi:MAG: hypothetical protein U1E27_03960, partial [Kiritimatiellia bacterium]|nr:hypothetical protein [Kiritimatiellia bacterium]
MNSEPRRWRASFGTTDIPRPAGSGDPAYNIRYRDLHRKPIAFTTLRPFAALSVVATIVLSALFRELVKLNPLAIFEVFRQIQSGEETKQQLQHFARI